MTTATPSAPSLADIEKLSRENAKLVKAMRGGRPASYNAEQTARAMAINAAKRLVSQEIGPLPAPVDPARRERCGKDAELFAHTYFGPTFYLPLAGYQREMFTAFQDVIATGGRACRAVRRGGLKSTIARACVLWASVYRHRRFPVLIGATDGSVERNREALFKLLQSSKLLIEDFPELKVLIRKRLQPRTDWRLDGRLLELSARDRDGFVVFPDIREALCDEVRIAPFSINATGVSGLSYVDHTGATIRPDLLVFDDVQTPQSAKSPSMTADREEAIDKTFGGLAGLGVEMGQIMVCTVRNPDCLTSRYLNRKRHPDWDGARFPSLVKMPENIKLWDQNAAMLSMGATPKAGVRMSVDHYFANRSAMDEGALVAWEFDRQDDEPSALYSLMSIRALDPEYFRTEIQQESVAPINTSGVKLDATTLGQRLSRIPRNVVPDQASYVTGFIDSQDQILLGMLVAWAKDFSGWVLSFQSWPDQGRPMFYKSDLAATISGQLPGASWEEAFVHAHNQFEQQLLADLPTVGGGFRSIDLLLKDWSDGGQKPRIESQVMASSERSRIRPSKGIAIKPGRKPVHLYGDAIKSRHNGSGWVERREDSPVHVQYDANHWKSFAARRLLTTVGSPSAIVLPGDEERANRMIVEHLTSETPHHATLDGASAVTWELIPGRDNEAWDCLVGNCVAASMLGCSLNGEVVTPNRKPIRTFALPGSR